MKASSIGPRCATTEQATTLRAGAVTSLEVLPARGQIQKTEHQPALQFEQLPEFMQELAQREGIAARALEFAILTGARTDQVTTAPWSEIDFDAKAWTIPASRMKAGKELRVPLSDQALDILRNLPREAGNEFIFMQSEQPSAEPV